MTDITTREEAEKLLATWGNGTPYQHNFDKAHHAPNLARSVIALHDELDRVRADAAAAVAMVVERAGNLAWSQQAGIDGVDRPWLEWVTDSSRSIAHEVASEIRRAIFDLAPTDGLAMG